MASTSRASKFAKGLKKERSSQSLSAVTAAAESRPSPVERRGRRTQKTRITVDLDPARYEFLRDFARMNEARGTEVLRTMIDLIEKDAEVASKVVASLEAAYADQHG